MTLETKKRFVMKVRNGVVLTAEQAIEIYKEKLMLLEPHSFKSCLQDLESRIKGQSTRVGIEYGVSSKTVRDIWTHRTWANSTAVLWSCTDTMQGKLILRSQKSSKRSFAFEAVGNDPLKAGCEKPATGLTRSNSEFHFKGNCKNKTQDLPCPYADEGGSNEAYETNVEGGDIRIATISSRRKEILLSKPFQAEISAHCSNGVETSERHFKTSAVASPATSKTVSVAEGAFDFCELPHVAFEDPFHGDWPHW